MIKYRAMSEDGDYQLRGSSFFHHDTPAAVAQAIKTRLRLTAGEWFLDDREGLGLSRILGVGTQATRDSEITSRILATPGVLEIVSYTSNVTQDRKFEVTVEVLTKFGNATITEIL